MSKFRQLAKSFSIVGLGAGILVGGQAAYKHFEEEERKNKLTSQQDNQQGHIIKSHIIQNKSIGIGQSQMESKKAEIQAKLEKEVNPQQNEEQLKKQQKVTINYQAPDFLSLKRLNQIPEFSFQIPKQQLQKVLIVSDLGFNQQFQQKIIERIKDVHKQSEGSITRIYRANFQDKATKEKLSKQFGAQIKQETIFLIKNQLDPHFINIDFDMMIQYPSVMNTYLKNLQLFDSSTADNYISMLENMSPNQSFLLHIYDDTEPVDVKEKRLLAAKYIEMQLVVNNLNSGIKVIPVEANLIRKNKIIVDEDKIRVNSLHLIRKQNQFTHANPNFYMKSKKTGQIIPYHLIPDIGLHNKKGEVAIQNYLSKVEIFNSLSFSTPFILAVTIDKNRISVENYQAIMNIFKQLRRSNKYPEIGLAFKFSEVGYLGKDHAQNNQFCIRISNLSEAQNQSYLHEIHTIQELKNCGISENEWLRQSFEYLYPHQIISEQLINNFIYKVLNNQQPQYYHSEKPSLINNIHKVVGNTFKSQILDNNKDHFIFEYSDNCPTCKMITPLIYHLNQAQSHLSVEDRLSIFVLNSMKNKAKGQVYSPYTPNLYFYKNQWKHAGPVRMPLENLHYKGILGLWEFCMITKILNNIDGAKFNDQIENSKKWNKNQFLL